MSHTNKALVLMAVAIMGIWGCAQGPTNGAASVERVKALEERCAKLEDDARALASARDQLRKQLKAGEEERARIAKELDLQRGVARERDALRQQLSTRTTERDAIQGQFDQFRQNLRSLLGQADNAAAKSAAQPLTASTEVTAAGKS
jgi:chromatin segregation and condensation protein Rec8/ScpA/Scc1 (kleisin family)